MQCPRSSEIKPRQKSFILAFQFFVVEEGKSAGVFLTKSRQNIFTVAPNGLDSISNQLSPEYRLDQKPCKSDLSEIGPVIL